MAAARHRTPALRHRLRPPDDGVASVARLWDPMAAVPHGGRPGDGGTRVPAGPPTLGAGRGPRSKGLGSSLAIRRTSPVRARGRGLSSARRRPLMAHGTCTSGVMFRVELSLKTGVWVRAKRRAHGSRRARSFVLLVPEPLFRNSCVSVQLLLRKCPLRGIGFPVEIHSGRTVLG